MVVSDNGKNRIRDLHEADISTVKLGTDNTAPTIGDTDLGTVDATTAATPSTTTGNKLVNTTHILLSTIGNGTTYYERGVFVNGGVTLHSRQVFPGFAQTANTELHSTDVMRFK